jgi:hypothetical protein
VYDITIIEMSTLLARKEETPTRRSTSMFIDRMLWIRVRKTAFDLGITATEFVEAALKEELKRADLKEKG